MLSGYLERKELPGLVALVSRHDDVQVETLGTMAVNIHRNAIFHRKNYFITLVNL